MTADNRIINRLPNGTRGAGALETPLTPLTTSTITELKMAKSNLGQTRPLARVISALSLALDIKLLSPSDFPDPLALYSLYCVIAKRQRCNEKPDSQFRPFKEREYLSAYDTCGEHLYWIRSLENFLGGRLIYSNANHRAQLTDFGYHLYLALMDGFLHLYKQNKRLESLKISWRTKYGDNDFKGFSP